MRDHYLSPVRFLSLALCVSAVALGGCTTSMDSGGDELGEGEQALSDSRCPDSVPASLTPAADQRLAFVLHGDGVQIYTCQAAGAGYAWTFVAPDANLLDEGGEVVGAHYAGPTWQSDDGSSVKAAKIAAANAPVAGAVPWLLLGAVSHSGSGKMSNVTTIQRLTTAGGVAPATGCDAAHVGESARVPYTADYFFYRTSNGNGDNPQCGG